MQGGSKWFHKVYIMIIQGGLKKVLVTKTNASCVWNYNW